VRTEAIDRFLAAVGVIMQGHSRLEELHRGAPYWELHGEFGEQLDQLARAVRELRRRALDIRTTPVKRVLERLPRVALDLGRELGKRVRVELAGEEVEVDRAVLDHLDDALLHLVRNAIDHGIESEAERAAAGKDPVGTLRVTASRVAGRLHLRLEEDGRGIDVEKVRRRAVERGLLVALVAEDLPAERILEFIFEPGVSTKDEVTDISGRGVGMDAVKRQVEALGGAIAVESRSGQGTAFVLDLPSMVALQRVIVLQVGGQRVALPIAAIEAVLSAEEAAVERAEVDAFFMLKDEPLPLVDLGPRLGLAPARAGGGSVVVLEARGFKLGLLVDRVVDDLEVFVRETPPALGALASLGGVAILRDGAPVFLLEVGSLVENFP
jgi:two-component system chemotaxis sensor kinase CheA